MVTADRGEDARDDRAAATAALVLEIATAAAGERDLDAILRATLDRLADVIPFTGGSIALVEGDELIIRAAAGRFADEALGQRLHRGPTLSWRVVGSLETIRIGDVLAEGRRATGKTAGAAIRSWLAVPIARRHVGIGLLEVDSTVAHAFDDDDEELVRIVARALAGPVDLAARYAAEQRASILRDAFTGVISHELRTPITTIYGMSQILRQRHRRLDPDELGRIIEDIEAEADRLRTLTEDLLVLSRAEGGRLDITRDPVLLGHLVGRAIAEERPRWPRHRFTTDISPGLPIVLGEEMYLGQVVRNLLSNAGKYSPDGSTITTIVRTEDGAVVVRVLDEGIGLPAEETDRLFELFYRSPAAARRASGAGIGLFVSRQLVEAMGGRIWARARADATGTEFGFALPAAAEADDEADLPLDADE